MGFRLGSALGLGERTLREFVTACLLHDVGHYPLSHSAEMGFINVVGASHHEIGEWIVRGSSRLPVERSLRPVLERQDVDADRVWAFISGATENAEDANLAALLTDAVNLDTLEGIPRVARSFGRRSVQVEVEKSFHVTGGTMYLAAEALPAIDRFWLLKDAMYTEVINLPSNIVFEADLSAAVERAVDVSIVDRLESLNDEALFSLLDQQVPAPQWFHKLDADLGFAKYERGGVVLTRRRKRYWVDVTVEPESLGLPRSAWRRRYRHAKEKIFLVPRERAEQLAFDHGVLGALEETDR